ncbi:hypothetical protein BC826DRAFT_1114180 [Russula brevipes]|nr:hypothetical protein BC826DRAFT_1114180 [Russula brevipes]
MASSKPERVSKKLLGRTDTEKALWTLDKLTQEEARVASAQGLWAMEHVNSRVKRVGGDVQCVGVNVQDVDERVKDNSAWTLSAVPCLSRLAVHPSGAVVLERMPLLTRSHLGFASPDRRFWSPSAFPRLTEGISQENGKMLNPS